MKFDALCKSIVELNFYFLTDFQDFHIHNLLIEFSAFMTTLIFNSFHKLELT